MLGARMAQGDRRLPEIADNRRVDTAAHRGEGQAAGLAALFSTLQRESLGYGVNPDRTVPSGSINGCGLSTRPTGRLFGPKREFGV